MLLFLLTVHEKIEILNDKLDLATGGEKYDGQDTSDAGATAWKAGVKKCKPEKLAANVKNH